MSQHSESEQTPVHSEDEGSGLFNHSYSPPPIFETSSRAPQNISHPVFTPRLHKNCFRLTSDDLTILGIESGANSSTGTLVVLPPGHTLTFVGAAYITLLQGAVTFLGTPIRPSLHSHRVFSPRSSPLASIEALDTSSIGDKTNNLLHSEGRKLPQQILNAINTSDSIVIIRPLVTGVEGLGKVCTIFGGVFEVGPDIREADAENVIGVEGFHPVDHQSRPHPQLQPFLIPESWDKSLDSVTAYSETERSSFVALIRGSRNCGKSTFARTLLNRLTARYRHVAFLECDLGQSEFTPGGMVALHIITKPVFGPPFTHPTIPHRAHFVGHSTPRSNPSHYLACIQALMDTYRTEVQDAYQETWGHNNFSDEVVRESLAKDSDIVLDDFIPLVVNTHGWNKGLGGNLLRKIEEIVEATDIFDFDMQAAAFPPQRIQHINPSSRIHVLRPILSSPLAAYYTPADHRSLSILSYFHSIFPPRGREVIAWSTELPLCARAPWEVDCKEAIERLVLIGAGFEDVVSEELEHALSCGIAALVCDEDPDITPAHPGVDGKGAAWPYTQGGPAPSPSTSHCLGLALIRGVNAVTSSLHLLTPVPPTMFSECRVLVKGELELPVWGMLDYRKGHGDGGVADVKWGKVPYLQMGGGEPGAIGGTRRRVRKNLMRRGQIL